MMVAAPTETLVDNAALAAARVQLGDNFARILGYFREDGDKSIDAIEAAMRIGNAAGLVIPAHTLKGEARQFGAVLLGDLAETIEMTARDCVERHAAPSTLAATAARLRPAFEATLALLERSAAISPPRRPAGFGRRGA